MVEQFNALADAGVPREPAFPESGYDTRLANVRQAMGKQDIYVLLVQHTPNFCYLAGFQTPLSNWYGCLIVPREGDLIAQVCDIEVASLMVHGWDNTNIHTIGLEARKLRRSDPDEAAGTAAPGGRLRRIGPGAAFSGGEVAGGDGARS